MRNYVIINGTNSLTIPGLAIKDLPPISKTLMRNQKEEIDGRDGDIITELGYSAYDKALTIGLYGNYDINQIIAFFNQKGTIVFSDEPDKYYNFTILDQIDYDKLVKFRTATIRIHCQPFKYPVSETPVEIEAEYITAQGEDITLNNTGVAPLEIGLKGNTYQETTTGKNLYNVFDTLAFGDIASVDSDGWITISYNNTGGSSTKYCDFKTKATNLVQTGQTYKLVIEIKNVSGTGNFNFAIVQPIGQVNTGVQPNLSALSVGTKIYDITMKSDFTGCTSLLNSYCSFPAGQSGSITFRMSVLADTSVTPQTFKYEPFTNGASPNPDFPMPVQVVTGDNTIKIENVNILPIQNEEVTNYGITCKISNGKIKLTGTVSSGYVWVKFTNGIDFSPNTPNITNNPTWFNQNIATGGNYSFKAFGTLNKNIYWHKNGTSGRNTLLSAGNNPTATKDLTNDIMSCISYYCGGTGTQINEEFELEAIKGNTAPTDFIPHQEQTYEINLGTLELCKIGNYQDYLYKSGENWYKHTEIGKYIANNDLTNNGAITTTIPMLTPSISALGNSVDLLSNLMLEAGSGDTRLAGTTSSGKVRVYLSTTYATTMAEANTYLTNNNFTIYFPLATPTEEQITNAELIEQLETILNAVSYEDQTNISQENDDMAFILDVSALKKGTDMAIVNNEGNIAAKPIIALKGNGTLGIYLDNTQMFSLNMTSDITIDTENMEAYDPNTSQLRNRQVTGDYSKFALQPGNNTIKVTGDFTSVTISKYKRWL